MAKYVLKKCWDTPINYPHNEIKGHFCGRKSEISSIKNIIERKPSSSLLLVGHRGAGKTSLIKKVLHELNKDSKSKLVLPIFINGPQLIKTNVSRSNTKNAIDSSHLLKILVTRLYRTLDFYSKSEAITKELRDKTEKLYRKAASNTFQDTSKDKNTYKTRTENLYNRVLVFAIKDLIKFSSLVLVCIFGLYFSVTAGESFPVWLKGVGTLGSLGTVGAVAFKSIKTLNMKNEDGSELTTEQYYFFDNDVCNVEFDLEKLQEDYSEENIKLVFVFDELDKVDLKVFNEVVDKFKNFFTLGNAHYIFVTDETVVESLPERGQIKRQRDYTYFNSIFYLSRPSIEDIEAFIKEVKNTNSDITTDEENVLIDNLIFRAKGDYFDLVRVMQDHINEYLEDLPVIEFQEEYFQKMDKKAKLQQALRLVFNLKYVSNHKEKWQQNEEILFSLYEFSHAVLNPPANNIVTEHEADDSYLMFSAKKDLATLFTRLGYLTFSSSSEVNLNRSKYINSRYNPTFDFTKNVPHQLSFLSQWEEDYVKGVEKLLVILEKVSILVNASKPSGDSEVESDSKNFTKNFNEYLVTLNNIGIGINLNQTSSLVDTYNSLKKDVPETYKVDEVEAQKTKLDSEVGKINNNWHKVVSTPLSKRLKESHPGLRVSTINSNNLNHSNHTRYLDEDFKSLVSSHPNIVISNSKLQKNILIINENTEKAFRGIRRLYSDQTPDNSKFDYKVIIIGVGRENSEIFDFINPNEDLSEKEVTRLIHGVGDWLVIQE